MDGEISTYDKRSFCPICGSRLFFMLDGAVEVFTGTLDQAPNDIEPMVEVWTVRRERWLPRVPGVRLYDEDEHALSDR